MRGILITSEDCTPCKVMKEELKDAIESGEVELVEFEKDPDRATELINQYKVGIPGLLILSEKGTVVATA